MKDKLIQILFISVILFSLFFLVIVAVHISKIKHKIETNEFVLKPMDYRNYFFDLNQKYMQNLLSPASVRYSFLLLEEDLEPKINPEVYMTFAIRRIYELQKWGNTLSVNLSIDSVEKLSSWEKSDTFSYGFWESNYFTYMQRIDSYIDRLIAIYPTKETRVLPLGRIYFHILLQKRDLESVIFTSQKTPSEKIHLKDLSDKIYHTLLEKIEKSSVPFDTFPLYYDLASLRGKPGQSYRVLLPNSIDGRVKKSATFFYADQPLKNNDAIIISQEHPLLQLKFQESNMVENKQWKKGPPPEPGVFVFSIDAGPFLAQTSYLLISDYLSNDIKVLQANEGPEPVARDYFFPTEKTLHQQVFIDRSNKLASSSGTLILLSQSAVIEKDLKKIKVQLIPYFMPQIIVVKK